MNRTVIAATILASLLSAASANATVVQLNFDLTASNFESGAPVHPVTGTFSLTFDNAASFVGATAGLSVTNFSLPSGATAKFSYEHSGDTLTISTNPSAVSYSVTPGQSEFGFFLFNASAANYYSSTFAYTTTANQLTFHAQDVSATATQASAVPEPASWTLMISGFAIAGFALRRRRARVPAKVLWTLGGPEPVAS